MAKQIIKQFRIQAAGGQATPAPPIGPALGQHGVNPGQFIQQFNAQTADLNGTVVNCIITVYRDRSFSFEVTKPPAPVLLKQAAGIETGASVPNRDRVGTVTREQVEGIAREKMADLNATSEAAACRMVEGTARSMGIKITEES